MSEGPPRIGGVIVARMDSHRLPGKVLTIQHGRPLLWYVVERVRATALSAIVVATSSRPIDDPIADVAEAMGVAVHRGPLADVGQRILQAARRLDFDWVARINGDSPLTDPALFDEGVRRVIERRPDFVTNLRPRTYPYGVALELVRTDVFARILRGRRRPEGREHAMLDIYDHLHALSWENVTDPQGPPDGPATRIRMTVDTVDDMAAFSAFAADRVSRWRDVPVAEAAASGHFSPLMQ